MSVGSRCSNTLVTHRRRRKGWSGQAKTLKGLNAANQGVLYSSMYMGGKGERSGRKWGTRHGLRKGEGSLGC
eukprot:9466939-Pyramimonas_sp.AAC.1